MLMIHVESRREAQCRIELIVANANLTHKQYSSSLNGDKHDDLNNGRSQGRDC